jgi:hypothetical protein
MKNKNQILVTMGKSIVAVLVVVAGILGCENAAQEETIATSQENVNRQVSRKRVVLNHNITKEFYYTCLSAFWGNQPVEYLVFDKAKIETICENENDFISFNPTDVKTVSDIKYEFVSEYNSLTSCYDVYMFETINALMVEGDVLKITKGKQIETPKGSFTNMLFKLEKIDGSFRFYDFSYNPPLG